MATAVHKATEDVAPKEVPLNGALSGRELVARLPYETVETSLGTVRVHGLGALDMLTIAPRARALADDDADGQLRLAIDAVAMGLDISPEQAGRLPVSVIGSLFTVVGKLSGLDAGAIEDAVAELKAHPNDES